MALKLGRGDQRAAFLSMLAVGALGALVLAGVAGRLGATGAGRQAADVSREPTLPERLAAVDEALGRQDLPGAIRGWREAFGVALRSRHWEAMADVGAAALRIDARAVRLGDHPAGFRAEARRAYLQALFRARAERSPGGVVRVADAFAGMGDSGTAARIRGMVAER
jgi:hypothetical protein